MRQSSLKTRRSAAYQANLDRLAEWSGMELSDLQIAKLYGFGSFEFHIDKGGDIELPDGPIDEKLEQLIGLGLIKPVRGTTWRRYYRVTA